MLSKILIANRGEIAVRIAQTCREMGIETVAIYSDADRAALHVRVADSAYRVGAAPARESYLNGPEIVRIAEHSGAQAVHPGYGFLAENAAFARAVVASGLTWIGPPASVIALLGDKVAAKRAAQEAGVPVVPGYDGTDASYEHLHDQAERIGYPVMLKAAAGGGGKGMRIVHYSSDLLESIEAARREALAAFGDDRIFMEKLLTHPRHVEIQILADSAGGVVYLGERECSLQRRHQKVIEEAPSPIMTPTLRTAMGEAAVSIARVSRYRNAGTVEFLLDGDDFYFLEVNTRIQVEHPVTEATFGLDLVRLQIEIAAGERMSFSQNDVVIRGHAIEARVYAEDPDQQFLPSTGPVEIFVPPEGPGIRNDIGVERGDAVSMHYDPMIAKLIVHAETRAQAVNRLRYALYRYACAGPKTNLRFLQWIAQHQAFETGNVDIGFIDREWRPGPAPVPPWQVLVAAALADAAGSVQAGDPWSAKSSWRLSGLSGRRRYSHGQERYELDLVRLDEQSWRIRVQDTDIETSLVEAREDRLVYRVGEQSISVAVAQTANGYALTYAGTAYELQRSQPAELHAHGGVGGTVDRNLTAPMPGTVVSIAVAEGQAVNMGEPLVIMEAMKMEHIVEAGSAGTVKAILVHPGEMVAAGAVLVQMDV